MGCLVYYLHVHIYIYFEILKRVFVCPRVTEVG